MWELALKHSVLYSDTSIPHFPLISWDIACWVAELNAALCLVTTRGYENIKYFPRGGTELTTVAFTVARLCHCAKKASIYIYEYMFFYIY